MKARDWQKYFEEQSRQGKNLFTVTELANVAGVSRRAVNVELSRLMRYGIVERYGRGNYGLPGRTTAETLLPSVDPYAYITGVYALLQRGLITQVPAAITCFTNHRHNRRETQTPAGRYVFSCVKKPIYHPPNQGALAEPEQALCDLVYMMRRRGADPRTVLTFRNLDRLRKAALADTARRYPVSVADYLATLMPKCKKAGMTRGRL